MYKNRHIYSYQGKNLIRFELNFVAKYKNRWIIVELDHTKWQNAWKIVPSTLQYVKKIWNWFPLSGKIDGLWHAHNRISNRSDAPLNWDVWIFKVAPGALVKIQRIWHRNACWIHTSVANHAHNECTRTHAKTCLILESWIPLKSMGKSIFVA